MLKILNFSSFCSIMYMIGISVLTISLKINSQYYIVLQAFAIILLTFSISSLFISGILLFKKANQCNNERKIKITSIFFIFGAIFGGAIFFICIYLAGKINPYL